MQRSPSPGDTSHLVTCDFKGRGRKGKKARSPPTQQSQHASEQPLPLSRREVKCHTRVSGVHQAGWVWGVRVVPGRGRWGPGLRGTVVPATRGETRQPYAVQLGAEEGES